jgi:hypothetical protein
MNIDQGITQRPEKCNVDRLVIDKGTAFSIRVYHAPNDQLPGIIDLIGGKKLFYGIIVTGYPETGLHHSVGARVPENSGIGLLSQNQ